MTIAEFAGCTFLAFGTPFSMFLFTIMPDPMRIIILIAAAFVWLVALLASSLVWFCLSPLQPPIVIGLVVSVLLQEAFRFGIYKILRKTENGLRAVADDLSITDNKHILAYVSGLGFGIMSGAFALVNILADAVSCAPDLHRIKLLFLTYFFSQSGPATMGLHGGSDIFFITSAAQTLCVILLHTCWSVIFFDACDQQDRRLLAFVLISHLGVSLLTLLNRYEMYAATLLPSYALLAVTACVAVRVAGGSCKSFVRFVKCQ